MSERGLNYCYPVIPQLGRFCWSFSRDRIEKRYSEGTVFNELRKSLIKFIWWLSKMPSHLWTNTFKMMKPYRIFNKWFTWSYVENTNAQISTFIYCKLLTIWNEIKGPSFFLLPSVSFGCARSKHLFIWRFFLFSFRF